MAHTIRPAIPAQKKLTFNIDEGLPAIFEKVNKIQLPYTFEIIKNKIIFTFSKGDVSIVSSERSGSV